MDSVLDRISTELQEHLDNFTILGSIYDPHTGQTGQVSYQHGNHYAIKGMIDDYNDTEKARAIAYEIHASEEDE